MRLVMMGTGTFVNPGAAAPYRAEPVITGNDVTLNFAGVDVRDVLKAVLGDLLHLSYTVDPAVSGTVTLQTGRPIPRSAVINVLASALQLSGVALVQRDGLFFAVPVANAARQAPLGGTAGLNFVSRTPGSQVGEGGRQGAFSLTVATRYAHFVGDIAGISVGEAGNPDTIQVTPTAAKAHEIALHLGVNGIW